MKYTGVILTLLFAAAAAGPINSDLFKDSSTCAKRCLDNHKFDYSTRHVYVYQYEADSKTGVVGASEEMASIHIKATVELEPSSACDFEMRLKDVHMVDPYVTPEASMSPVDFGKMLAKWPLRFAFQDGRVDDVCPNAEDPIWSLNIKRGILSVFQNSMMRLKKDQTLIETDVTGKCKTTYTVSKDGKIIKTKDMVSCKQRQGVQSAVQSIGYDTTSSIQSLPIMKSTYSCEQMIKPENIIGQAICTEKQIFRPFSNGENGAATVNTQKLLFIRTDKAGKNQKGKVALRTDLLFSHKFGGSGSENDGNYIQMILRELCKMSKDDVRPEQPKVFKSLVKAMKMVNAATLIGVYSKQVKNGKICRENRDKIKGIFHDAIPMVGTSSSLELMRKLIWEKDVVGIEKDMWLASLPFIQNPDKEMLAAMKPLLEDTNVESNTILMISSLVSGYCAVNPNCEHVTEVTEIMEVLKRIIGKCSAKGSYEKTLYALRAIGNIGHSSSIVPSLVPCFTHRENPIHVRLAAIDAYRRIPCDVMRLELMELFNDISEDAELRISAYLALMKCPQKNIIRRIKETLRNEEVNQVGSFVWTHLTNLKETSDPHLQELRTVLEEEKLKKEFNLDKRKFSRNYEGSLFLEEINAGGKVDGNLIFSPKSFVPRSANLNLTIDLFGSAINIFEIGTRMEGVEYFLERYFGNNGYFKNKMDPATNQKHPMKPFDDQYKVDIDSLKGFAYTRMFGNEFGFWHFNDPNLSFFKNFDIKKWVKNEKIVFNKNVDLMDTQLIVPTILGLPLNLTVSAVASMEVEAAGKMNLASLKNIEIAGSIKPSAAVKVVSQMTVDAFATRAGLRMNSLAHTSTEGKLSFTMKNSKVVESKFELPKQKMEIVTIKSDFSIIRGDNVRLQKMIDNNRFSKSKCTGDKFNRITGLELCTKIGFSNASMKHDAPYFPFTGPIEMQIELKNHDMPNGYIMKTHMNEATNFGFEIDTPNSKVGRKISLDINVNKQAPKIEFDSPWKRVVFNGKFVKTRNTQLVSGEIILDHKNSKVDKYLASFELDHMSGKGGMRWHPKMVIMSPTRKMVIDGNITSSGKSIDAHLEATGIFKDEVSFKLTASKSKKGYSCVSTLRFGAKEYNLKTKVGTVPKGKAIVYSPELTFTAGGDELINFVSSFLYNPNSKIIVTMKLDKVFSKIVALNTKITINSNDKKMKHNLVFNLKAPKTAVDIKGAMELKESRFFARILTNYNIGKFQNKLAISCKAFDESTKTLSKYRGDLTVESNKFPKYNFKLNGLVGKAEGHIETKFDLTIGNPKRNPDQMIFESKLDYQLKPMQKNINYIMLFKRPSKNVDIGLEITHKNIHSKKVESYVKLNNGVEMTAQLQFNLINAQNFNGFAQVKYNGEELFHIEEKMSSKKPQQYENSLNVRIPSGKSIMLETSFGKKSDRSFFMNSNLKLPNQGQIKVISTMHIEKENGSMHVEINADRSTIRAEAWNPKISFNYHIDMLRQKLSLFQCKLIVAMSSTEVIKTIYSLRVDEYTTAQDLDFESTFKALKKLILHYDNKRQRGIYNENFSLKLDDYFSYDEKFVIKSDKESFLIDYKLKQKWSGVDQDIIFKFSSNDKKTAGLIDYKSTSNSVTFEMMMDHTPINWNMEAKADISLPHNGFTFNMKSDILINFREISFKSDGEIKLQHSRTNVDLTYSARADANRINFDTNFVSPTSRHRNGKFNIEIGTNEERTKFMGKFDVDVNGKRLYSLSTGYAFENMVHNFQLLFLLPSGERMTQVFKINLSENQKTIRAEIKLPRAWNSFELDMDGSMDCMKKVCEYKMSLTTNTPYFRKMTATMKHDMGLIDLMVKFDGFKKMQFVAKIEGETWTKNMIVSSFKIDETEKLKLTGEYAFDSLRNIDAKLMVVSNIGRTTDEIKFLVKRAKSMLDISGELNLFNEKYIVMITGTDFKEIKAEVRTPTHNYHVDWVLNKLKWNDFDVQIKVKQDSVEHTFSFVNHHLRDVKLSVALAGYDKFEIVYNGGIDGQKRGSFRSKISYGQYFFESNSTVDMANQFQLKSSAAFKIFIAALSQKVHTGSGEIKLTHHMDSIFQKIGVNLIYDKSKITFSSLVKNSGKINMNIRLKTNLDFTAQLKAQISPDMLDTNMVLNLFTPFTGPKTLSYKHSVQKGRHLEINTDLSSGQSKDSDYTLSIMASMKNEYGLKIELTTDRMTKKYVFDGGISMKAQMVKGKLRLEAPFAFMEGMPIEISFKRDGSKFHSNGIFKMMEYSIDVEYSPMRIMTKASVNWNKEDKASNFNFEMNFEDASQGQRTDKKFELKLIHPVRTVVFSTKYVKNLNMFDIDILFNGNLEKGQQVGLGFGRTQNAGYVKLALPERTYKISGRFDAGPDSQVFSGSFFWNFEKDDSKKIDLTIKTERRTRGAVFDMILKFPSQSQGIRLMSELTWLRGDTLFKSKTEFSMNQDPQNILTAQMELLKDDNNKYTLMMALKHPKRDQDILITVRMFELNHNLTASMEMKVGRETFSTMGYLDKKNKEISLKVTFPNYNADIFAHYVKGKDYEISAKMVEGSGKPMEAYINLSPSRKNLKFKVNYDDYMPEKSYKIDGSLLTNEMLMVEAFRMNGQEKNIDSRIDFIVENGNILHGKIVWRPQGISEFNEFLYKNMLKNMQRMQVFMNAVYRTMAEQGGRVAGTLHRAYSPEIDSIKTYVLKEFREVESETVMMIKQISEMYDRNYLYLNTMTRRVSEAFSEVEYKLFQAISYVEFYFREAFMQQYAMLLKKMEEAKMKIGHIYQESYRKLTYDIEQAKIYVMKKMQMLNSMWVAKRDEYLRNLNELNRKTYQAVFNYKYTKAIVMALNQRWEELINFMRENQMMKPVSDLISYVRMHMDDIIRARDWLMHQIKTHAITHEIFDFVNEFYQKLLWTYKYWQVEQTLRNIDDRVTNYITKTANGIREQIFSMNKMELITFDLHSGEIEFKLPIVMPKVIVENQVRVAKFMRMVKKTVNNFNKWHPENNYTLADLYYSLKPSSNPTDWIPPFKAQASIFRNQHITTFDGVHLDFKGDCSYILTRDFVDNNFTVVAKFGNINRVQKIESIIFYAGSEQLEIFHDYQIRHNNQKVDLPIKLNALSVNRFGNKMEIHSSRGFTITFNPIHGAVIVDISGWYFGKVGGLFGTYNNEQFDDMTMAEQRRTRSVDELALSWAIPGCRSKKNYAQTERKTQHCVQWFGKESSPFRNCFRQVKPESFYHYCNTEYTSERDLCTVVQFYLDRCAEKGVQLDMPEQCVSCKTRKGEEFKVGNEIVISAESRREELGQSADVVFVIEQRKCNERIVADLNRIILGLEQTLRDKGMNDNRYGLVGFGGDNIRPEYSVTIKSELMGSAALLMNEVRNLKFYDGYSITDPLKAINLATQYQFRPATRKTIVLVTCNMFCHEKTIPYHKVMNQLKEHDIALHLLQKYQFEISGNKSPKTTDLYGIDSKQVFTKTESQAKEKMFETIKLPSSDCAELSLASNGSVFDADKMSRSDLSMFVKRFSQRIADSLERLDCHHCHCGQNEFGMVQSICTRCPSLIPHSSPFYLPGKLFQGNFQINENLKEQLSAYWGRFQKKNLKGQAKAASKKSRNKSRR